MIDKIKNGENTPRFAVVEVVLVQCNLVDNQYPQKPEVLYTFVSYKFYAYLLNVEPSNLVFLKTYDTDFDEIIITFTDQNSRPLEIEDKVNLTLLLIKRNDLIFYRTKNKKMLKNKRYGKDIDSYHVVEIYLTNIKSNYWIQD